MLTRRLGATGPEVSAIGLGCMGMSDLYGPADRDEVLISVRFGGRRDPAGNWIGHDARPAAVKTSLAYTLRRLGVDHVDPSVPIEETVGAIAEMAGAAAGDRYGAVRMATLDSERRWPRPRSS